MIIIALSFCVAQDECIVRTGETELQLYRTILEPRSPQSKSTPIANGDEYLMSAGGTGVRVCQYAGRQRFNCLKQSVVC